MIHKTFTRASIVILIMLAFLVIPVSVRAGGACDSTYTVQWGDTLGSIAEICGTTVSDLYNANPGLGETLYAGQVLTIPSDSSNYNNNDYNNYNGTNSNPYDYNYSPTSAYGTYTVQPGDTFGDIANRYGMSINDLSNANPYIGDQDLLYPGQIINIPAPSYSTPVPPSQYYGPQPGQQPGYGYVPPSQYYGPQPGQQPGYGSVPPSQYYGPQPGRQPGYGYGPPSRWYGYVPTPTEITTPLAYGMVSPGSPMATLQLSNKANGKVYVSLQGTARDGTNVIREYPVSGTFSVTIPAGYYDYVASVGGQEFTGSFNLPGHSSHSLTFHAHEVDVQ
jgi:LysM repeat protein